MKSGALTRQNNTWKPPPPPPIPVFNSLTHFTDNTIVYWNAHIFVSLYAKNKQFFFYHKATNKIKHICAVLMRVPFEILHVITWKDFRRLFCYLDRQMFETLGVSTRSFWKSSIFFLLINIKNYQFIYTLYT